MEMLNLLKVHVITDEDLEEFLREGSCSSIQELNNNIDNFDFYYDYAQTALVDANENKVIMWNDNMHSHIDDDIDSFLGGIIYSKNNYTLKEVCMLEKDMEQFSGVKYR